MRKYSEKAEKKIEKVMHEFNRGRAIDFLLQTEMPANTDTYSHFYPHHRSAYVCGKNSPGAPVFIGLSAFTTKLRAARYRSISVLEGTLKSGKDGKGGKVKSRKQAIAIGINEAKRAGAKVPRKK